MHPQRHNLTSTTTSPSNRGVEIIMNTPSTTTAVMEQSDHHPTSMMMESLTPYPHHTTTNEELDDLNQLDEYLIDRDWTLFRLVDDAPQNDNDDSISCCSLSETMSLSSCTEELCNDDYDCDENNLSRNLFEEKLDCNNNDYDEAPGYFGYSVPSPTSIVVEATNAAAQDLSTTPTKITLDDKLCKLRNQLWKQSLKSSLFHRSDPATTACGISSS